MGSDETMRREGDGHRRRKCGKENVSMVRNGNGKLCYIIKFAGRDEAKGGRFNGEAVGVHSAARVPPGWGGAKRAAIGSERRDGTRPGKAGNDLPCLRREGEAPGFMHGHGTVTIREMPTLAA